MKSLTLVAFAAVVLASAQAHAEGPATSGVVIPDTAGALSPGEALPAPHYPPKSVRLKLIAGGVFLVAAAWGAGWAGQTQTSGIPGISSLKYPVAGPWMALAQTACQAGDTNCTANEVARGFLYVLIGITQIGGLGLMAEGIVMTTEKEPAKAGAVRIVPMPIVTAHSTGFGLVGSF